MSNETRFGVDVALGRADDLDKLLLNELADNPVSNVLDIGCGAGGQSLRMLALAARVTGVDIVDYSDEFSQLISNTDHDIKEVKFIFADILETIDSFKDDSFDYVCVQRMIHYLPYNKAKQLLQKLKGITKEKMFISASGLKSEIGDYYKHAKLPIQKRFTTLDDIGRDKFKISAPICLYQKSEFEKLILDSGWQLDSCWPSAFGNIKAVAY